MDVHRRLKPATTESERQTRGCETSLEPCWTCRRKRLKCDRSLPACHKCTQTERICEGYKKPLKWEVGVASRGKMMCKNFNITRSIEQGKPVTSELDRNCRLLSSRNVPSSVQQDLSSLPMSISSSLADPLPQGLSSVSRQYLLYCKSVSHSNLNAMARYHLLIILQIS